jgi:hypothetical protein
MKWVLLLFVTLLFVSSCNQQKFDIKYLEIKDIRFDCQDYETCCEEGVELGEVSIQMEILDVSLTFETLYLKGIFKSGYTEDWRGLTLIHGMANQDKICPIEILGHPNEQSGNFEITLVINSQSILYFDMLGFESRFFEVGKLLNR